MPGAQITVDAPTYFSTSSAQRALYSEHKEVQLSDIMSLFAKGAERGYAVRRKLEAKLVYTREELLYTRKTMPCCDVRHPYTLTIVVLILRTEPPRVEQDSQPRRLIRAASALASLASGVELRDRVPTRNHEIVSGWSVRCTDKKKEGRAS